MNDIRVTNRMRGLIIDAIDKAKSGHPGGALSSLDFAYILFTEFLRFDPDDHSWLGRDRFVLSAGHESMLLYTLLYFQGFLELDELKNFRQLHSRTPGHPECTLTKGVECTTGPLGQGAAMSVGFAIGSKHLSARLDERLFSQRIWALLGDGCMQTPVAMGAASIAGHLRLGNLVWYYDRNQVQISGRIDRVTSDRVDQVFHGFGWNVHEVDAHNHDEIRKMLGQILASDGQKPTLIIGNSVMGRGTFSMEGNKETHGAPLPKDEYEKTREKLGLPADRKFFVEPEDISHFRRNYERLRKEVSDWDDYKKRKMGEQAFSRMYRAFFEKRDFTDLPDIAWDRKAPMATRNAFGTILEQFADHIPNLIGGSADLDPSNCTSGWV
ncbi:MAG: transketolase, partial [Oligoflexales bacterium]|nr:transketolase [Oligoflexales bacterium]